MVNFNSRYVDAQNFSQNASELLLARGQLVEFLDSLGFCLSTNRSGDGYLGLCPVCRMSNCMIGVNGGRHRVWWRCLSRTCKAGRDDFGTPRNLLSLVKFLVGSQREAFGAISAFLGYEGRSFDITNGKAKLTEPTRPVEEKTYRSCGREVGEQEAIPEYVFLVDDEATRARFERAGIQAAVFDQDQSPKQKYIFCLMEHERGTIAERLRDGSNVVEAYDPASFMDDPGAIARDVIDFVTNVEGSDEYF